MLQVQPFYLIDYNKQISKSDCVDAHTDLLYCPHSYPSLCDMTQIVEITGTVLPPKSDSDFIFVYKVIKDLLSIYHSCINPILWIGLIHQ